MNDMNTISEPMKEGIALNTPSADALVFFGATGDLAHKKIFPALQALVSQSKNDRGMANSANQAIKAIRGRQ